MTSTQQEIREKLNKLKQHLAETYPLQHITPHPQYDLDVEQFFIAEIEAAEKRGYDEGIIDGKDGMDDTNDVVFLAGQKAVVEQVNELIEKELKVRKLGGDVTTRMILESIFSSLQTLEDNLNK